MRNARVFLLVILIGFFVLHVSHHKSSFIRHVYAGVIGGEEDPGTGEPGGGTTNPGTGEPGSENPGGDTPASPTDTPTPTTDPGGGDPGGGDPAEEPTPTPSNKPVPTCPNQLPCPNPSSTPTPTPIGCGGTCTSSTPGGGENPGGGGAATGSSYCGPNLVCVGGKCVNVNPTCAADDAAKTCQCPPDNSCTCAGLACNDSDPNRGRAVLNPIVTTSPPGCATFACNELIINGQPSNCSQLTPPPTPPIVFDKLDGKSCKTYSLSVSDGSNPACGCSGQICCPKCEQPQVEPGYEDGCAKCDFAIGVGGQEKSCACVGKKITIESETGGCVDLGNGMRDCGSPEEPPEGEYGDAGFYPIEFSCEVGGKTYTCKKTVVVGCSCTDDLEPTPTPATPEATEWWYKLRDDQFHKRDAIDNPIPAIISAYDGDDVPRPTPACDVSDPENIRCFDLNQAGVVAAVSTIDLGGATVSARMWRGENYPLNTVNEFTPSVYLQYVKSRKQVNTIEDFADLAKNKINIYNGNLTINDIDRAGNGKKIIEILEDEALTPYVLIINGDLIVETDFNKSDPLTSPLSTAIVVTGTTNIHYSTVEMGGIFITQALDFSYGGVSPSDYRLKIKGNIVSFTPTDPGTRRRTDDPTKPSIFVIHDAGLYLDLAGLLSRPVYEWEELAP